MKIVDKNKIVVPAEFQSGGDFDYSKKYSTVSSADNYFMKLGYPGNMIKTAYNLSNPSGTLTAKSTFINYLQLGLRYTRDSVLIKYPQDKYPLIIKYYDITVKYMQSKYDWDITKMAEWPAIKED